MAGLWKNEYYFEIKKICDERIQPDVLVVEMVRSYENFHFLVFDVYNSYQNIFKILV